MTAFWLPPFIDCQPSSLLHFLRDLQELWRWWRYLPPPRRLCFHCCLSVCSLATLRKNFQTDFHEIFRECWRWANEQMIKFWWQSGWWYVPWWRYALSQCFQFAGWCWLLDWCSCTLVAIANEFCLFCWLMLPLIIYNVLIAVNSENRASYRIGSVRSAMYHGIEAIPT